MSVQDEIKRVTAPDIRARKGGKPIVYVKSGSAFQSRDVEIKYRTESRVAVEGLPEGTEVALVNPEQAMKKSQKAATPLAPAEGVGSR